MGQQSVRRFAPVAVAVLVLALIGVVWGVLRGGDTGAGSGAGSGDASDAGSEGHEPLALVGWLPASGRTPDPRYHLAPDASLPDTPEPVPVHQVAAGDAGRLRAALRGAMGAGAGPLTVDRFGRWSTADPVVSASPGSGTASPAPGTAAPPPAASPTVARPVLEAAGLGDAQVTTETAGAGTTVVSADPTVGGLPTSGMGTQLVVSGPRVSSATGWLARTPAGPAYPVVSARAAYDLLTRTPLPMPLMACPEPLPPGADPVPCGGPITVTGARLGLALRQTADGYLLVPAWLFTVRGSAQPLVQVAVQPRLLRPADPAGTGGGSGSSGGSGSTGSVPGSSGTAPVPSTVPAEPAPPASRFTAVRAEAGGRSLEVRFWGGVRDCYSYAVRVTESPRQVALGLVETRTAGNRPCIDLAQEWRRTARLAAPLGQRPVVDADTGAVLLAPAR